MKRKKPYKGECRYKTKLCGSLLVLCMAFSFTDSMAQSSGSAGEEIAIGAKVGANFNQFSRPGTTLGGSVGGYVRYAALDFLEVQGELLYSRIGGGRRDFSRTTIAEDILYTNRDVRLHTIELPISARLGLPELNGGAVVPKLIVGGGYAYNFAAFEKRDAIFQFANGANGLIPDLDENVGSDYAKHIFSAHVGIALDYNLPNGKMLTMEFKYRRGLNDVNKIKTNVIELTDRLYPSGFNINFSYRIY
ncbi:outer membrane beta-barrel protein [Flagellimonas pacifica]|uniref:Outer membrane protein beta-barrel domain-containing protein n=1 Tax=Flagellimonas pacifica TaxID=1247520 RepID=A0A285MSF2_9FLAO|nr:outer membrane beta-barrel protein [Allomuricauda parva]SNZ00129.1 Outer membrane protein beta-barrel domain-containing protein [Allomuricauda parva]